MNDSNGQPPANGHALSVDRVIDAEPEAIFDGFIAMYDSQRPDWVTESELDLRPGGRWTVDFQVLSELASRMSAAWRISSSSMPRRPAVSMMTTFCWRCRASRAR